MDIFEKIDRIKTVYVGSRSGSDRVAKMTAALHKKYPDMSSRQIGNLMRNQLTPSFNSGNSGGIQVLDSKKSNDFLAS